MRPYLAIIKDSFREAFHSRVLWIVLVIITLFLLGVSPLSYRQTLTTGLREGEVNWPSLVAELTKAKAGQGNRGVQRVWSLLSSTTQAAVEKYKPLPKVPQFKDHSNHADAIKPIMKDLETILKKDDLYQSTAFASVSLRMEGKELLRREKELATDERQRLNRLLLESAFGDSIETSQGTSLQLRTAWWDMFPPLPISKPQLVTTVRVLLPFLVDKGLLAIGLLIAIIVTAPSIPHTFDPGSLHLLLSKPVSRSLLYLSKFVGSCAFVLLCATYLFIGLYLLLGSRWAVWEPRLLWCIPIYTFVFAVYYSVAALAGLIWRNVIVSILVAILFWSICFGVGWAKIFVEGSMNRYRVTEIIPVEQTLVVVDGTNTPYAWDTERDSWKVVFLPKDTRDARPFIVWFAALPPMHGPVYDHQNKRLVASMISISNGQQLLGTAQADDGFAHQEGPASPFSPLALISEPDGQPLLITRQGLYRPQGELGVGADEIKVLGFKLPFTSRGPLRDAGPTPSQTWDEPFTATCAADGMLFTFSRGKLQNFTRNKDGKYELLKTEKFEKRSERRAWIAAGKSTLLVGFRDGKLQLRDPQTLELRKMVEPAAGERPRDVAASPDGKWIAVILESRQLWLLEDGQEQFKLASVSGQGDLSAVEFTRDGKMLVVNLVDRVTEYEVGTWKRTRRFTPPMHMQTVAYHYIIHPIYTLCPKPGEFYRTITYLLLDPADTKTTADADEGDQRGDDAPPRTIQNPWQPVYSSLAFMLVMLAFGCLYMERQEF